jgi:V/A-type H+-transporting ATPase subunit C
MANHLLRYSGLITKTKAMGAQLLTESELHQLAERTTVSEVVSYLSDHPGYDHIFDQWEGEWNRGQAESVIRNSLYEEFKKLYQFSDLDQREGLTFVIWRYEADILKFCLRCIYHNIDELANYQPNEFITKHIHLPISELKRCSDMPDFILRMQNTPYESVFLPTNESTADSHGIFTQRIDISYYERSYRSLKRIRNSDLKELVRTILGTQIDWLNIMWIYREIRFYRRSPSAIYASLIPITYRLKSSEVQQMVRVTEVRELIELIGNTTYFKGKTALLEMEDEISYQKIIRRMYSYVVHKYPYSLAPVLKYIHEKEQEIERVTTIIEGIRYQLPPKEIRDLILITI